MEILRTGFQAFIYVLLTLCTSCAVLKWDGTGIREFDGMRMVYVKAGEFWMGSTDDQLKAAMDTCEQVHEDPDACRRSFYRDEQPAHTVTLDGFWINQTEVTNRQFVRFLNAKGNQQEEGIDWWEPGYGSRGVVYGVIDEADGEFTVEEAYADYPVVEVSWYGARAYCDWVGGRLPTEAEWEYAARGPEGRIYPWGDAFNAQRLNYAGTKYSFRGVEWMPAGSFEEGASWCGALEMAGNVWEWTNDWWSEYAYVLSSDHNPTGPQTGTLKVARGGSWYDEPWHVRCAYRKGLSPSSYRIHWISFRCVFPEEKIMK